MLLLIPFSYDTSFADVTNFTTDKSLYHFGDSMKISGNVVYDSAIPTIIIQIITPSGSGLAHIDSAIPKIDGTFTKTIHAGGPTWNEDGKYTIKISYAGNLEKLIDYEEISSSSKPSSQSGSPESSNPPMSSSEPDTTIAITPSSTEIEPDISFTENPKMRIFGFPSFDKSPQYYIDRYNTEPEYQSWFDSQFPDETIYDVLGFSTDIPDWIKIYAKNWAIGDISDSEFMSGLDFMLQNKIIVIPGIDYIDSSIDEVPSWFRNTSHWWANDSISQQEFINAIKFLIQKDIILIE